MLHMFIFGFFFCFCFILPGLAISSEKSARTSESWEGEIKVWLSLFVSVTNAMLGLSQHVLQVLCHQARKPQPWNGLHI